MHGFRVFLGKEFREIFKTWRIWVLPLIFVFIGITSPILAKFTPQLVASVTGGQSGLQIQIPDPVTRDAYLQFSKNAIQMVLIAVIITSAGLIAGERKVGTAILVLTKPVSRSAMVVAKVLSNWALLIGSTLLGAVLCFGITAVMFDATLARQFAEATGLWLLLGAMIVSVMALLSVVFKSQAGASGVGVALYLVLSIMTAWGPSRDYTPAALMGAGDRILAGQSVDLLWPVLTAVAVSIVAVTAAALVFERQEL